jgi:hypothetical protein
MSVSEGQHKITAAQIKVRQVTSWQPTWTEKAAGAAGTFTIQLILDEGADEYVLRPTAEDAEVLQELFSKAPNVYFDIDRKVLMFGVRPAGK